MFLLRVWSEQVRDAVVDCVAEVRRRETELLAQLRAAFAGDPAVQAFIADRPSIEATLRGLENTCQLTDIIVRERSVELLLLKDDIASRMTSLLETAVIELPPRMRSSYVQFIPTPRNEPFPIGRLDFVNEKVSPSVDEMDAGLRPRGDGHDAVPDGAADSDDGIKYGAIKPEVEIKRRKVDSDVEIEDQNEEDSSGEMLSKRLITTSDRETMTVESCVKSASTTMDRCVHVEDKLTATSSQVTVDRSTLTRRPAESRDRGTETDPQQDSSSVKFSSQTAQTAASVFQLRSKYVETEPPSLVNKWTLTERPFQMDKVGHTQTLFSSLFINAGSALDFYL